MVDYWDTWLAQHPEQSETVAAAARLVRGIPFIARELTEEQVHQAWLDLQSRLPGAESAQRVPMKQQVSKRNWLRVAAAVALVVVAGTLAWWSAESGTEQLVYATAYGETRTVYLPDGSEVTINAHSRVIYQEQTEPVPLREVWLKGEAFFQVVHLDHPASVPFLVHTPDLLVQVLGTRFNVNTRRGRTQVVLDAGSVALQLPSAETTALQPGELAEYTAQDAQVHKEAVDTKLFTAWRDRRLKFDDTPLSEVALMLEENYGVRVVFDNPLLRSKRVTGEVSANALETILLALSKLFDMSVQQSGDTIHIARHTISP